MLAQSLPEAEPNDTSATASLIVPGVQSYGDIGPLSTDVDYYAFTLAAASDVRAMTSPGFVNQVDDTMLTLIAPDGVTVLTTNDDTTGRGYYSQVTAGNLAPGTYFLKVESFFGSYVGSYCLDLIVAPNCDLVTQLAAIQPEGAEPNDPRVSGGVATMTTYDSRNSGNISASAGTTSYTNATSDYDFWGFTVAAAGSITVATCPTTGAPAPTISDTVLFLTDANYTVLATNDDSCGLRSQIIYTVPAPGLYYAVVKGYSGSGNYYLDIGTPPPACSAAAITNATFLANPGGCVGSNGTPHLGVRETTSHLGVFPERPLIGTEFVMDLTNVPAGTAWIQVLGFVTLPLPGFDLGPLGAPGCFVETSPLVNTIAFTTATGDAFWSLPIPYNLALCGLPLELQGAVFDPPANLLGITVSNRGSAVIGNGY
jgi:hypothetical protein